MNRSTRRALLTALIIAASMHVIVGAQGPGQNINVITGSDDQFTGDIFRQRQNESVVGISSVNPSNMVIAYNDYRTVDIPDDFGVGTISPAQGFVAKLMNFFRAPWRLGRDSTPPRELKTAAHAWIGLSFSNNGGKSWYGGLHPGRTAIISPNPIPGLPEHDVPIPSDVQGEWLAGAERLHEFTAASDAVMATTPNQFFLGGIAFNSPPPGGNGKSIGFVSRFTDLNNSEQGQTVHFDGTKILLETESSAKFVDKPSIAAGPNGHVYAAFVVFDQADPSKLSSKILVFRSDDFGESWDGPVVVSQPLSRNQSPWIIVDPTNEEIVYIGWRVFAAQPGGWANAIVGKKSINGGVSFTPSFPYPVAPLLKAYDVPQGNLSGPNPTAPSPRSNAYPTAAIDGKGAIHVAIQEYVYPATHPIALLRGRPLLPGVPVTVGVPRVTTTTSYNGGATWTLRKAADLGTNAAPAGAQFMPVLTAAGEPGPSCGGSSGPRSRVMLMFYDARNGGVGLAPGGLGYLTGGDKRFDVRIAQASACSSNGLTFSPSEQVSQYTHTTGSEAGTDFPIVKIPGTDLPAVNRAYSMFCGGNCAFTGDYMHLVPRVPYFQTSTGDWKPTTAVTNPADRQSLPAPVTFAVWADTRNAVTPSTGPPRPVPAGPMSIDAMPWNVYGPAGTGQLSCVNPGARDQNIYAAEYTPGGLYAAAPATFKTSSIPRSYPLYVENRTPFTKYYRLSIKPSANNTPANASFDFTDFDATHANFGAPLLQRTSVTVGPISSVAGTVVVGPGVTTPVLVTVEETGAPVQVSLDPQGNPVFEGGPIIAPPLGAMSSVTLRPLGTDPNASETFAPAIDPVPIVSHPLGKRGEAGSLIPSTGLTLPIAPANIPGPTPFGPNPFGPNPFGPNPFGPNPFGPNPFGPNPFGPNPFGPNDGVNGEVVVYEVTDISYIVTNEGEQTAAFRALANVTPKEGRVYQLLLNRAVPTPVLNPDTCVASDKWQAVPISVIANPFGPNPFGPNPFGPNPFGPNPFGPNPFGPNPAPIPQEFSNSTFYVKPAGSGDGIQTLNINDPAYVADPTPDAMVFSVREWLLVLPVENDPDTQPITEDEVEVEIEATIPEFTGGVGGGYEDTPPAAGTQIPHHLAFTVQPSNTSAGQPIAPPVQVTVKDAFDNIVLEAPGNSSPVTIVLPPHPSGGTLSGTLTVNAVGGIATFNNLKIDKGGDGYTLVASSGSLPVVTSEAFNVVPFSLTSKDWNGTVGAPSSFSLLDQIENGVGPFTFALDPNAKVAVLNSDGQPTYDANGNPVLQPATLPPGDPSFSLNATTGIISGTPTTVGDFSFRIIVTDTITGLTVAQHFCIEVDPNLAPALVTKDLSQLVTPDTAGGALPGIVTAISLAEGLADPDEGGVIISNAVVRGSPSAIGSFTGGGTSTVDGLGFHTGILLSSGNLSGARGPNGISSQTTPVSGPGVPVLPQDQIDLSGLANTATGNVFDAAILEFDFTPTCADGALECDVTFDYVFGSDEYHEYANSNFNDVFGFFVTDTVTGDKGNIAKLPNTTTPVSINTVNGGNPLGSNAQNPQFFRSNRTLTNIAGPINLQADGLTTQLTAVAEDVKSGRTYRIKLAISDVTDSAWDSWVFVKSGSFKVTHICPVIVVLPPQ